MACPRTFYDYGDFPKDQQANNLESIDEMGNFKWCAESPINSPRSLSENRKPTAENPFWPDFPFIFVKERNYSPQMNEKPDSKVLSLATASILGQAPSSAFTNFVEFRP